MKPTRASDQGRKPRNSNQKPRKLQIPNQLSVHLPRVNEADTYPTNLITKGKMAGKPVRLVLDTGASVSAIKEVLKEIYGHVPFSAVQTGKDNLLRRTIILPLYLTSECSVQPPAGNLPSRYPKNKEVALSQSLLILVLIAVPLSATFHTDANGNFRSVIQKPLPSFAQVSQKKVWHQCNLSDTPAKIDYRMESTEGFDQYQEAPPGMEMPKFIMHLRRLLIL